MSTITPSSTQVAPPAPKWWQNEDWLAVVAGSGLIAAVLAGWKPSIPKFKWSSFVDFSAIFSSTTLIAILVTSLVLVLVGTLVIGASVRGKILAFFSGSLVVFALGWLAQILAANVEVKAWGFEYVLFSLSLGLFWSHTFPVPSWLTTAIRTEFFIKIGIVLLGAGMLFSELVEAGIPGLIQAALVIPVVWHFTFRLARKLKVDDEFGVMLSTAVSICGVSAAIAACGAIQGDKKKLSYVTSVVLLCAAPMMVLMPWMVKWLGLSAEVGGAWLGGTLDTSGSVLAATEMLGESASKTGTVVKLSQNVLIGFAAFFISVWWSMRGKAEGEKVERPTLGVIWERFPKFVIGFMVASLLFSFALSPEVVKATSSSLKGMREIWFSAAFVCIGLETRIGDLKKLGGGRPAIAFLGGQAVNVVWTLLLALILFGWLKASF